MNEHSQLQVLIAKQIMPLAQQLDYLPRVQPKGRNNGKLSACKRALTNNTEFSLERTYEHFDVVCYGSTIILKVIKRTFSWPVAPGDALPTPDAGGWAGTFGCTFGMASMASIILWFVHAENVQNPLSKDEKQKNNTKGNLLHQKKQVHRNLHCLVLMHKKRENKQYTSLGTGM